MNDQQVQPQSPPPNYLAWAIITTILCCIPFGIVSIVYAAMVNSKWHAGDLEGAQKASKNAKIWIWVSVGFGILSIVLTMVIFGVGIFAAIMSGEFDGLSL